MRVEKSITVNAPAEKVFEYLADLTRHPEWGTKPMEVRKTSEGPVGVGSTFSHVGKQMGTHHDEVRVTEYAPPSKLAFESTGSAGTLRHWFSLLEDGGVTRITKGVEGVNLSLSSKLMAPVISMLLPVDFGKNLAKIKERVEGSAG